MSIIVIREKRETMPEHCSDPTAPAYISYCRTCHGMTGCCADELNHRADVGAFVAACIHAGDYIQRSDAAAVWAATWCTCINDNGQPLLFTEERLVTK